MVTSVPPAIAPDDGDIDCTVGGGAKVNRLLGVLVPSGVVTSTDAGPTGAEIEPFVITLLVAQKIVVSLTTVNCAPHETPPMLALVASVNPVPDIV
jgi:hypothetical protein